MCDQNGHMNVAYYLQAFDVNSRDLFEEIGFDEDYFQSGYSCFAIEDSLRYLREFLEGDEIRSMFRIHDFNEKVIHIVGVCSIAKIDYQRFLKHLWFILICIRERLH